MQTREDDTDSSSGADSFRSTFTHQHSGSGTKSDSDGGTTSALRGSVLGEELTAEPEAISSNDRYDNQSLFDPSFDCTQSTVPQNIFDNNAYREDSDASDMTCGTKNNGDSGPSWDPTMFAQSQAGNFSTNGQESGTGSESSGVDPTILAQCHAFSPFTDHKNGETYPASTTIEPEGPSASCLSSTRASTVSRSCSDTHQNTSSPTQEPSRKRSFDPLYDVSTTSTERSRERRLASASAPTETTVLNLDSKTIQASSLPDPSTEPTDSNADYSTVGLTRNPTFQTGGFTSHTYTESADIPPPVPPKIPLDSPVIAQSTTVSAPTAQSGHTTGKTWGRSDLEPTETPPPYSMRAQTCRPRRSERWLQQPSRVFIRGVKSFSRSVRSTLDDTLHKLKESFRSDRRSRSSSNADSEYGSSEVPGNQSRRQRHEVNLRDSYLPSNARSDWAATYAGLVFSDGVVQAWSAMYAEPDFRGKGECNLSDWHMQQCEAYSRATASRAAD